MMECYKLFVRENTLDESVWIAIKLLEKKWDNFLFILLKLHENFMLQKLNFVESLTHENNINRILVKYFTKLVI